MSIDPFSATGREVLCVLPGREALLCAPTAPGREVPSAPYAFSPAMRSFGGSCSPCREVIWRRRLLSLGLSSVGGASTPLGEPPSPKS